MMQGSPKKRFFNLKLQVLTAIWSMVLCPVLLQLILGMTELATHRAGMNKRAGKVFCLDMVLDIVLRLVAEYVADGAGVATLLLPHKLQQVIKVCET